MKKKSSKENGVIYPPIDYLNIALENVLSNEEKFGKPFRVVKRTPNLYSSTFHSEIVSCEFPDKKTQNIFCKFSDGKEIKKHAGHRQYLEYEAKVNRLILQNTDLSIINFVGSYSDSTNCFTWLFFEYLEPFLEVGEEKDYSSAMIRAARWIGEFHSQNKNKVKLNKSWMFKYSRDYLISVSSQTLANCKSFLHEEPWIIEACNIFDYKINKLTNNSSLTMIHGEYYPANILSKNKIIYPVDWQSAAIAIGEIDLAMLTDGWQPEIVDRCVEQYTKSRWGKNIPINFKENLILSTIYTQFRWLGDKNGIVLNKESKKRLNTIKEVYKLL